MVEPADQPIDITMLPHTGTSVGCLVAALGLLLLLWLWNMIDGERNKRK